MNAVSTNNWANQIVGLVWQAQAFVLAIIRLSEKDHLPTLLIALHVRESWVFACFGYGACMTSLHSPRSDIHTSQTTPVTWSPPSMPRLIMYR